MKDKKAILARKAVREKKKTIPLINASVLWSKLINKSWKHRRRVYQD